MDGKGRPEKLTDELKKWIVTHQQGRKKKLKATAIRADMRIYIESQVRKEYPTLTDNRINSEVDSRLPGLSAIQKYLKPLNKNLDELSVLDTPWHLGTLERFPLDPVAVAKIFELKAKGLDYLSIRTAQWISRLCSLPLSVDMLYMTAFEYSMSQQISELVGVVYLKKHGLF